MNKNLQILIERYYSGSKQALGKLFVMENNLNVIFQCDTLELPWENNQKKISHIPTGTYEVVKRWSPKFSNHFHITGTPDRSLILIHAGNTFYDIEGCILPGDDLRDINGDGHLDVINSKKTLERLLKIMPDKFLLTITERL